MTIGWGLVCCFAVALGFYIKNLSFVSKEKFPGEIDQFSTGYLNYEDALISRCDIIEEYFYSKWVWSPQYFALRNSKPVSITGVGSKDHAPDRRNPARESDYTSDWHGFFRF